MKDLITGGCDPDLARRLVADAGSDRDASTRIRGVIDLVVGGIGLIIAAAVTYYIIAAIPGDTPTPRNARGAGYLFVVPVVSGFGGIFLSVRGLWRTLFAKD